MYKIKETSMKRFFGIFILICFISFGFSPVSNNPSAIRIPEGTWQTGIDFKNSTFENALAEAKKTGKLIFLDAYTDWCGPCKNMAATSFKNEAVASLYNAKFINIKIEMEKSPEGPGLAQKYGIKAYPSLLFLDGDGKIVKYVVGFQSANQLIDIANSIK